MKDREDATIHYTLPLPHAQVSVEAGVLEIDQAGGAEGSRTPDPLNAIEVLSQLSYSPTRWVVKD